MTTLRPLLEIAPDLIALNELFEAEGGELGSPEAEAAFDEWAASLQQEEGKKLDGYCNLIKALDGEAAVAKAEAEQYQMKARTRENRVKWLKERMKLFLELTGRTKVQTATGRTIRVQMNGGKVSCSLREGFHPENLPKEFVVVKIVPDFDHIRDSLTTQGKNSPVAEFAQVEERGKHVRIA